MFKWLPDKNLDDFTAEKVRRQQNDNHQKMLYDELCKVRDAVNEASKAGKNEITYVSVNPMMLVFIQDELKERGFEIVSHIGKDDKIIVSWKLKEGAGNVN